MMNKRIVPKDVTNALQEVTFPNGTESIVDLDMVQEIRIAGKRVRFSLVFQRNDDPNIKNVVIASENAIKKHLGADIDIEDGITVKYIHDMQRPVLPNVKNIIAVSSGKGGVGKSTIAVNLAVALANSGAKVGLVDADIFGPSIPKMFGAEGEHPIGEVVDGREIINPIIKYGIKFLSIGFFVDTESALVWRGPMASNALKQLLTEGNWGELDYLLIDLPPGTSDIHLTLMQSVPVTAAIIVTTPQDVALADVIRGNSMFASKSVDVPVLGLVENMSWFTPKELPDNKYYIFGKDGGKNLADRLGLELLMQIPIVQSIREGGDSGMPVALQENSILSNSFAKLAQKIKHLVHLRNIQRAPTQKIVIERNR